jgi:hypothetical protein
MSNDDEDLINYINETVGDMADQGFTGKEFECLVRSES